MSKQEKYRALFFREAAEHLASLQHGLLEMERHPENGELLQELMRNAHTIKGSARMIRLESIGSIAHRLEDQFMRLKNQETAVTPKLIDLLLAGSDTLSLLISAAQNGKETNIDLQPLMVSFDRGELEQTVLTVLTVPQSPLMQTTAELSSLEEVRVPVVTLERMSRYFGELELVRRRLVARLEGFEQTGRGAEHQPRRERAPLHGFTDDLRELDSLLQDVAGQAGSLRMLPLSSLTDGIDRIVRDLARSQGKEVRVTVSGADLEIDRQVLDDLRPVFTHILTNAVIHGIEEPAERRTAGKNSSGELLISAGQEGERFFLTFHDDGRGMDPAQIRTAALEKGIITPEEASLLSDDEALYLTLRHGFSTQADVGELAGRGVGLDIVAEKLRSIKGSILLSSEPGRFCELTLLLPRSLMRLDGLLVAAGAERYVVPAAHVAEVVLLAGNELSAGSDGLIYTAEPSLPVLSLNDIFQLPTRPCLVRQPGLVLVHRGRRILCLVDAVLGTDSMVLLRLSRQFVTVKYVIGATLLEDGIPVLILNVLDLFSLLKGDFCPIAPRMPAPVQIETRRVHLLVVDDSLTSRNLLAAILAAQGYHVATALNGLEALNMLANKSFDMLITDYEMPEMDGITFVTRLREMFSADLLPVMMVSSLSTDEDKARAYAAGVQAYMVKGSFDQDLFLAAVQTFTQSRDSEAA